MPKFTITVEADYDDTTEYRNMKKETIIQNLNVIASQIENDYRYHKNRGHSLTRHYQTYEIEIDPPSKVVKQPAQQLELVGDQK